MHCYATHQAITLDKAKPMGWVEEEDVMRGRGVLREEDRSEICLVVCGGGREETYIPQSHDA